VVGLNRTDLNFESRSVIVRGKGNKEREVYWGHKANIHLKRWLESRKDECPALFSTVNRPYVRASPHTLYHEIKQVAKRCGLGEHVSPHKYRHTLATMLLNNGADVSVIQSLLGHSKPSTTMVYVTLRGTRRKNEYDRYFMQ
jgi:integrase/recombinase XerD